MISSSASMPIVVIFERHWDEAPKQIVKNLIPKLSEEGYDTFCLEAPQNLEEREFLSSFQAGLELDIKINSQAQDCLERVGIRNIRLSDIGFEKLADLMRLYVSSQRYLEVAERIKNLPAHLLLKDTFRIAKRLSLNIKGIDIDEADFEKIISKDVSKRMKIIKENENYRIATISKNLLQLYKERNGVIFVCGALHAENLINKFKENNLDERILYYFPHSNKKYDDSIDDIKEGLSNEKLRNHTFCLIDENNHKLLVEKIIKDIKSKNIQYKQEIVGGNSHSIFLSNFFQKDFRAFMRPGYYVDALLNIENSDNTEEIITKLKEVNIQIEKTALLGSTYLVIKDINTKEVADNIRQLN
jgi:hypothetical protein